MSATRDQSQKVTFLFSNLYQVYKKGHQTAKDYKPSQASGIIKVRDKNQVIEKHEPVQFITKYVDHLKQPKLEAVPESAEIIQKHALLGLKDNLKSLNDLHSRLRFMLKELEDLVKED